MGSAETRGHFEAQLEAIGYGENMIKIRDSHPGWMPPKCKSASSPRLFLLLPATMRSFEHLTGHIAAWAKQTNDECAFVSVAVDPNVDISSDAAVVDFTKAHPDYGKHVLTHAQNVMGGRLAWLTFERNDWNCVGGPRCQRYAIPLVMETLRWAMCYHGTPIRDTDVVVKGRPDLHYRESLAFSPLAAEIKKAPQTMFWMRKFKSRWSDADDPTDQLIIGGLQGMKAWVGFFSFTLRTCDEHQVKSNWIGLPGLRHRLIEPARLHFCMVRHTGIMDDGTKSCNTQPYKGGAHPKITVESAPAPVEKSDITQGMTCFTKLVGGSVPSGARRVSAMWPAVAGEPICENNGPWPSTGRKVGVYQKSDCDDAVV